MRFSTKIIIGLLLMVPGLVVGFILCGIMKFAFYIGITIVILLGCLGVVSIIDAITDKIVKRQFAREQAEELFY